MGYNRNNLRKRVRKLQHNWTIEQTEHLIEAVQNREGMWNNECQDYKDRNVRDSLWQEVADELGLPRLEVATKWNSLRCSFRATYIKMCQRPHKAFSPPRVFTMLKFLEPTLRIEEPLENSSNVFAADQCVVEFMEADFGQSPTRNCTKKPPKRRRSELEAEYTNQSEEEFIDANTLQSSKQNPLFEKQKRRASEDDEKFGKLIQGALKTMSDVTKNDPWDDLGNFIASIGREIGAENAHIARRYKAALMEVSLNYQNDFVNYMESN